MAFVPTLCEVSYDSEWDRYSTPYRIPLLNSPRKCGTISIENGILGFDKLSACSRYASSSSFSYYDYLRNYYFERCSPRTNGGNVTSPSLPSRRDTGLAWGVPQDASHTFCREEVQDPLSLPSVRNNEEEGETGEEERERLIWVDALNAWVPQKRLQGKNYLSFVNTPPVVEKYYTQISREQGGGECSRRRRTPCGRFQSHMRHFQAAPPCRVGHVNLKRAMALQKHVSVKESPDTTSRRPHRKAYSTPLSNAETRRKLISHSARRPQTPDMAPVYEPKPPSPPAEMLQPAWGEPDYPEEEQVEEQGEATQTREEDEFEEERLELRSEDFEEEVVDSALIEDTQLMTSAHVDNVDEEGKCASSHSTDYQELPAAYFSQSPPLLPQLVQPSPPSPIQPATPVPTPILPPITREASVVSVESCSTVDTVPTLPSISIQFVEPHPSKDVHFPIVVAAEHVQLEPEKVPFRLETLKGDNRVEEGETTGKYMFATHKKPAPAYGKRQRITFDTVVTMIPEKPPPDKTAVNLSEVARNNKIQNKTPESSSEGVKKTKSPTQKVKQTHSKPVTPNKSRSPTKMNTPRAKKQSPQKKKSIKSAQKPQKAPKPVPIKTVRSERTSSSRASSGGESRPQPLPVSLPSVKSPPPPPKPPQTPPPKPPTPPTTSPTQEEETQIAQESEDEEASSEKDREVQVKSKGRSQIKKRERVTNRRQCKTEEPETVETEEPPQLEVRRSSWIFGKGETETQTDTPEVAEVTLEQPSLPSIIPRLPSSTSQTTIHRVQKKLQAFRQPIEVRKKWGPRKRDTSYEDELRKQELAEARRKRQTEMMERMRKRHFRQTMEEEGLSGVPSFEDYGFLSKYCIFNRTNLEMYKHAFQAVDDERRGWLTGTEAMIALRGTNNRLTETEEEYLYRILELTGYSVSNGADFKLFSVLAALSQRISSLDHWMKNIIGRVDFKTLEMKMFMCKSLWECNVDRDTNKIPLEQLMIELRAGGVSYEHECEVREKLSHMKSLDLLDFLTYVPLFIMIHESVVDNPLDDSRQK